MNKKIALTIILLVSLSGLIFSGVLSYQELFVTEALSCPSVGAPGTIFGYPACVYGFFMYLIIVAVSSSGLFRK